MNNDLTPSIPAEISALLLANGFKDYPCLPGYVQFLKDDECITFTDNSLSRQMQCLDLVNGVMKWGQTSYYYTVCPWKHIDPENIRTLLVVMNVLTYNKASV